MISPESLLLFIGAALLVLVVPGPGVAYVVATSVARGRGAGIVSASGLAFGALVHALAAATGLTLVLLASATAFEVVKLAGAGYLIYLGLRALFGSSGKPGHCAQHTPGSGRLFVDGVVVSLFNPKIALFFAAFLPQFVNPALGHVELQLLALGTLYSVLAFFTDSGYAILAATLRQRFAPQKQARGPLQVASGITYIALGVTTALTNRN